MPGDKRESEYLWVWGIRKGDPRLLRRGETIEEALAAARAGR